MQLQIKDDVAKQRYGAAYLSNVLNYELSFLQIFQCVKSKPFGTCPFLYMTHEVEKPAARKQVDLWHAAAGSFNLNSSIGCFTIVSAVLIMLSQLRLCESRARM